MAPPLPAGPMGASSQPKVKQSAKTVKLELFQDFCCPFSRKNYHTLFPNGEFVFKDIARGGPHLDGDEQPSVFLNCNGVVNQ